MKAIWINSSEKKIKQVDIKGLEDMQRLVGHPGEPATITTATRWDNGDYCFVDDNGLLVPNDTFFFIQDGPQPFAGNGLIVGPEDAKGNLLDCRHSLEEVEDAVTFLSRFEVIRVIEQDGEFHA